MKNLRVNLKDNSYNIFIEDDILFHLSFYIKEIYNNKKIYIITDDIVYNLYALQVRKSLLNYDINFVVIKNGEESKCLSVYSDTIEKLIELDIRRNELLIALGGGVIGDLTGFIASTLYRGLPYVSIPTTLLSQMDSSIGGKTGIDFNNKKNIIGCFKQPKLVLIDPNTLKTLPEIEFNNGMAELIKHAIIGDKDLFLKLKKKININEDIIYQSLMVKKRVVELDEFDLNERMLLNFGHTFGHIIELENNIRHGYAVGIGIILAIKFGIDLGISNINLLEEVKQVLSIYNLFNDSFDYKKYIIKTVNDKKNLAGIINFILIKDIASPVIYPITEEKLKDVI